MSLPFSMEELKAKASETVALALKMGAGTAVAHMHNKTELEVTSRNGETENLSEAESQAIALTLSVKGRRATVSSCDTGKASLTSLVEQALAMCRYTDEDPFYSLPDPELLAKNPVSQDIFDQNLIHRDVDGCINRAKNIEGHLTHRDQIRSDGAFVAIGASGSAMANSLGFCEGEASTLMETGISVIADDGAEGENTGRKQNGNWSSRAHHREDLQSDQQLAHRAVERVQQKLGARKPKTGKFPVYFEPTTARTLWGHLLSAISGTNIYRNNSYLVDRLGTDICAPLVTIKEDPFLPRGLRSRAFDTEGVARKPRTIVSQGKLETYLMSTYSANKLKMQSTGHAGGISNLLITPGALSEREILREMGTGVWITTVFGQGTDISSGDYSRGALGLWIENGEVAYPVNEFTINSNLDRMFRDIVLIGNEPYKEAAIQTPGLLIGEMNLSGS